MAIDIALKDRSEAAVRNMAAVAVMGMLYHACEMPLLLCRLHLLPVDFWVQFKVLVTPANITNGHII